MQNFLNLKIQLTSIDFQFNSLITQIQNLGMNLNINYQINSLSFQILYFGIQMLNLSLKSDNNMINKQSIKEQINGTIIQLKNISGNISNNNISQNINTNYNVENDKLKNEINTLNEKQTINIFKDSKIISINEYDMISNWISPNKKIKFNLLYRASSDGDKSKDFHDKCDNKGSTFCIFHLDNEYIIGGYSSVSWENSGGLRKDPNAFICSITNKEKYELINKNGYSIYFDVIFGPGFCDESMSADIIIRDNCLNRYDGIQVLRHGYNSSMLKLIGKETNSRIDCKLKDYEVYQVI